MACRAVVVLALPVAATGVREPVFERVMREIVHSHGAPNVAPSDLELPVDPYDALNEATWKMRFWADTSHWDGSSDAPVFLSMGGEGTAGPAGGQMVDFASEYRGLLLAIEHRYYGESIPTADFSTDNLQWLSARYALADAAAFQRSMTSQFNLSSSARWITFGGSYSGQLAAWARIKYPHLFYAAVASSAPVSGIVDYDGYDPIVADALRRPDLGGSQACHDAVASAFAQLENLFEYNRSSLQSIFGTCGPVEADGDAFLLHDYVSDDFMGLVQYNRDTPGQTNIRSRCVQMVDTVFGETPFDRLVNITRERAEKYDCIFDIDPSNVKDTISFASHLKGYADPSNSDRSFPYQECVDGCGHDQTCKAELGCIFSPKYSARSFFQEQCKAAFGVTQEQTDAAVARISTEFGDNLPGGSRIVFVNGDIDPFHFGSVTQNTSELLARDITAYVAVGGSHCQDMGQANPESDTASMTSVKRNKARAVARWLSEAEFAMVV